MIGFTFVGVCVFTFQSFFFSCILGRQLSLFTHCSSTVNRTHSHFIQKKNIKNGSHSTIHTFKNYFATVFLVSAKISCIKTNPYCSTLVFIFALYFFFIREKKSHTDMCVIIDILTYTIQCKK